MVKNELKAIFKDIYFLNLIIKKTKMNKKKTEDQEKPKVHQDLDGFDIKINSFGEIQMSYDIDRLNEFLNEKVDDKKLKGVDIEEVKKKTKKKK